MVVDGAWVEQLLAEVGVLEVEVVEEVVRGGKRMRAEWRAP